MTRTRPNAARSTAAALRPLHAAGRAAVTVGDDGLTLEARVMPWDTPASVTDDGRTFYTESWAPGSLIPDERVVIYDGHTPAGDGPHRLNTDRRPIGMAHSFRAEADGLYATLSLTTGRGRDVYDLARLWGAVDVSIETVTEHGASGTVARTSADPRPLTGLAIVLPPFRGAYDGAVATAARAASDEDPPADDDDDDTAGEGDDAAGPASAGAGAGRAAIAEVVRREVARYAGAPAARRATPGPLARYRSFPELVTAARAMDGDQAAELQTAFTAAYRAHRDLETLAGQGVVGRALVDQVTADNPGVMPPSWLSTVFGIVDRGRPGITALGGPRSPGASGMDVYWPYYDGDLLAIVKKQTAEKAPVNSVKISFKRGQATLDTYGAASDVSYQLQRRSSPAYMGLHDQIMQIAYGQTTEYAFDTVLAGIDATPTALDLTTDTDGNKLRALLFAASSIVYNVTGEPATAVLCASNVFAAVGSMPWLFPSMYGTANVAGTSQASNLQVNVSGLTLTNVPGLPAGTMIVTNAQAAAWFEEGPFIVTAEDVEKLGTNVAIWGMGTTGVFLPGAVVEITVTGPPPPIPFEGRTGSDDDDAATPARKK